MDPNGNVITALTIGAIIGGLIGLGMGAIFMPMFANMLNLGGWKRTAFIAIGIVALTAIGSILGYYTAKLFVAIYAKGILFAHKLNAAIAKLIAKITGATLTLANGDGWVLKLHNFTVRIMNSSIENINYIRISMEGKGAMTIMGTFSSDPLLTHIPITIDNIIKLIQILLGGK